MTLHIWRVKMLQQATPLTVQLVYDRKWPPWDPTPVVDQSILRLMRDTKLVLHPVHGATIRFRIEEEEKFRLRVSTNNPSIAPALSSAVSVRSRNPYRSLRVQDIKRNAEMREKVKKTHSLAILNPVQHTFPPSFTRV